LTADFTASLSGHDVCAPREYMKSAVRRPESSAATALVPRKLETKAEASSLRMSLPLQGRAALAMALVREGDMSAKAPLRPVCQIEHDPGRYSAQIAIYSA
jgi:hypothetical protein